MLSNRTWETMNKAAAGLKQYIGKKLQHNGHEYIITGYTLSGQLQLSRSDGSNDFDFTYIWRDEIGNYNLY